MKHILTVNVEDYFQVGAFRHLIAAQDWERFETRLSNSVASTLSLLARFEAHATFFVTGWIAEKYPQVLPPIIAAGHELGSQTYYHQAIRDIPPNAFADDIRRSKALVEQATGRQVAGFRVGRDWIRPDDTWALEAVSAAGFSYDSSFCPIGSRQHSKPQHNDIHQPLAGVDLLEIPISAVPLIGFDMPFAGGNYLRQLPPAFTDFAISRWLRAGDHPLVVYFHTWEIDSAQPDITAASWLQRIRHYRNLDRMQIRLEHLLRRFEFDSIASKLGLDEKPAPASTTSAVLENSPAPPVDEISGEDPVQLTIVVPCLNESDSIAYLARTLDAFQASAPALALSYVFVDDGSTDDTADKLENTFGEQPNAKVIALPGNQGIAAAILAGVEVADDELVAVIDADCTFDPNQIPSMLPLLEDDVAAVCASPLHDAGHTRNVPAWRMALSKGAAALYRLVLRNQLSSYTSCFRIYRRSMIAGMRISNPGFCGVAEILAKLDLAGCRLVETSAELQTRLLGQSKIRLVSVTLDHLRLLCRIVAVRYLGMRSL